MNYFIETGQTPARSEYIVRPGLKIRMDLLTKTVPVNNSLLTVTCPVNNSLLTGTMEIG